MSADANGWLSIETAPKGREKILVWDGGATFIVWWAYTFLNNANGRIYGWMDGSHQIFPTHWQPLPKPPAQP